jgi:hypothetical protein
MEPNGKAIKSAPPRFEEKPRNRTSGEELNRANQILKALLEEYKGAAISPVTLNGNWQA